MWQIYFFQLKIFLIHEKIIFVLVFLVTIIFCSFNTKMVFDSIFECNKLSEIKFYLFSIVRWNLTLLL